MRAELGIERVNNIHVFFLILTAELLSDEQSNALKAVLLSK